MLEYHPKLKEPARRLRKEMTDAEQLLWSRLRRKQLEGVQFYRQKPLGTYIVDFYAPAAKLVIEVDGDQHFESEHLRRDQERDQNLGAEGLRVLRFTNAEVLHETEAVLLKIIAAMSGGLFSKGELKTDSLEVPL